MKGQDLLGTLLGKYEFLMNNDITPTGLGSGALYIIHGFKGYTQYISLHT